MINHLLLYSLKSALALTILYVPYLLILQKERYFKLNRMVLLCIIMLSLVLPFFNISVLSIDDVPVVETIHNHMIEVGMPIDVAGGNEGNIAKATLLEHYTLFDILSTIFFAGMAILVVIRSIQLGIFSYALRYRNQWTKKQDDGTTICCRKGDFGPFSWINTIVISEDDLNGDTSREILLHETGHIKAKHSFDMLLLMLCQAIQWYNPFAWNMANSLSDVHEFEADDYVLGQGADISGYMKLLVKKIAEYNGYTFVNNLSKGTMRKRIMMMKSASPVNPMRKVKVLLLLPFCFISLCAFATKKLIDEPFERFVKKYHYDVTPERVQNDQEDEEHVIFIVCEEPPMFEGGDEALSAFINSNIVYPESCLDAGIEGVVVVSMNVYKDGTVADFEAIRSPHPDLTTAAINILQKMPKWIPGRQRGNTVVAQSIIPISFKIDNQKK